MAGGRTVSRWPLTDGRCLQVVTGRWLVDGNPQIILFDVGSASWKLNEMKDELWNLAGVGIPHPDVECNDAVVFGYMVAEFLQQVRLRWTAGGGADDTRLRTNVRKRRFHSPSSYYRKILIITGRYNLATHYNNQ